MIRLKDVSKQYDDQVLFSRFNLDIEDQKITGILGPSGIGKTTLINLIAHLSDPDSGSVEGVRKEELSYIFQEPRLLPWMNVYDNLSFALKHVIRDEYIRNDLIRQTLKSVGLSDEMNKFPDQLSGGMKQRLAIARAFAYPSSLMIMDEPFKGLDPKMKASVMQAFLDLWEQSNRTVIFVTHDVDEILALADTIHVIAGRPVDIVHTRHVEHPRRQNDSHEERKDLRDILISL